MQDLTHIGGEERSPVWFNDRLVDFENAQVHVVTHAMNYGTAVFEGIRVYGTSGGVSLFRLDAHLARLIASAAKFGIEVPWTEDDIAGACVETVRASCRSQGYIRPQIQFGVGTPALAHPDLPS